MPKKEKSSSVKEVAVDKPEPPDIGKELAEARALVDGIRDDPAIFSARGVRVAACDLLTQALDAIERRVTDPEAE